MLTTKKLVTLPNIWNVFFIETIKGERLSQPMRFFPRLQKASVAQKKQWTESSFGLHWNKIDEDISFESFSWADNDATRLYHA
jgi:hypothetical protein